MQPEMFPDLPLYAVALHGEGRVSLGNRQSQTRRAALVLRCYQQEGRAAPTQPNPECVVKLVCATQALRWQEPSPFDELRVVRPQPRT